MYRIIDCITLQHNYWLLSLSLLLCVTGSVLSVLLAQRLMHADIQRRLLQVGLTSIIGGTTIWSTHFIAMLAYDPGLSHGYEPTLTGLSLLIATLGLAISMSVLAFCAHKRRSWLSGALFGFTISAMHYLGMSAYLLPGDIIWETDRLLLSVGLGVGLGTLTFSYITAESSRNHWLVGVFLMISAICAMHFSGMAAFTIQLNSIREVAPQVITDEQLGILVMAVAFVIYMMGFASFLIESRLEQESRSQLRHAALHDPLTDLPNRLHLNSKLDEIAKRPWNNEDETISILTIDLNLFKQVNDFHGHAIGDTVLKTIATRLSQNLKDGEFIARSGGDEFIAFKCCTSHPDQVNAFAERLLSDIVQQVDTTLASITVGAAIGIATSNAKGCDFDDLLYKSDLAMYRAKSQTDLQICHFTPEIDQHRQDRLLLVQDLETSIEDGEFELAYQLQNNATSLEPFGFEALLRWNHPKKGQIPPEKFIQIIEENGMIRDIGLWVLRTACNAASQWPIPFHIAVNIAPQQLIQPSFVDHVADILAQSRLDPGRLELEITEVSFIEDEARTLSVMHQLKDKGIRIAMDDFGTGYSSLSTLQSFPFDKIKIDKSFIKDIHVKPQRAAIVRSTLLLGDALGIPVLAEGVETEEELAFLQKEKCFAVQGYYFGRPLTQSDVDEFFRSKTQTKAS